MCISVFPKNQPENPISIRGHWAEIFPLKENTLYKLARTTDARVPAPAAACR